MGWAPTQIPRVRSLVHSTRKLHVVNFYIVDQPRQSLIHPLRGSLARALRRREAPTYALLTRVSRLK